MPPLHDRPDLSYQFLPTIISFSHSLFRLCTTNQIYQPLAIYLREGKKTQPGHRGEGRHNLDLLQVDGRRRP
jgi:hypothetical protein